MAATTKQFVEQATQRFTLIALTSLGLVFAWLYARVQGVLPAVMQDEYVYSMQARKLPLAELEYPNYLFSWLYGGTDVCGLSYYSCAKTLNLVFFAGFIAVIFAVAFALLGRWWALAIALATALGPAGVYTSVFMPESMYFFFATASLATLWWVVGRGADTAEGSRAGLAPWWQLLGAGALLGLTALVKPHALFLALAAVLYLLTVYWPRFKDFGVAAGFYLAGLFAVKFGLGLLLAGPAGLTLLGPSYTRSFVNLIENLTSSGAPVGLVAGGAAEVVLTEVSERPAGLAGFISESLYQLAWQTSAVLLVAGALIAVSLGALASDGQRLATLAPGVKRLAQLATISLGVMVAVIAAFAALVTVEGDDHSLRLLFRYYEFLIPLLTIAALAVLKSTADGGPRAQNPLQNWRAAALAGLAAIIATLGYLLWFAQLNQQFADSPLLMGVTSSEGLANFVWLAGLVALGALFASSRIALASLAAISLIAIATIGSASHQRIINLAGTPSSIDYAGYLARDLLIDVPGEEILYLGTNKQLVEASIFAMDKPNVDFRLLGPGQFFDSAEAAAAGKTWLVAISEAQVRGREQYRVVGNGFIVSRIASEQEHFFAQEMIDTPIDSVQGLGLKTSWGRWADGTQGDLVINFSELLPSSASLSLTLVPSAATANQLLTLRVGDAEAQVQLGDAGLGITVDLTFNNGLPASQVVIPLPSDPQALGLVSLRVD